jgi:hypothetical protein
VIAFYFAPNYCIGEENQVNSISGYKNEPDTTVLWKQLNINQDERVDILLRRHVDINKDKGKTKGFRIQIFSEAGGSAGKKAMQVKTSFLSNYPDVKADINYTAPDFKVRVGNFRTRSEALKFQKRLIKHHPHAIIVEDKIDFPEL